MSAQKAEPSRVAKIAFNGGELSPYLRGRLELARLYTGAKELTNFMTLPQGPMTRRAGTVFQAKLEPPVPVSTFIPEVDTANGPYLEEEGEENNFDYEWTLRETDPITEPDLYRFVYGNGVVPDVSAELYIQEEEEPDQFSLTFDATGAPVIGFVEDELVTLRKRVGGDMTTYAPFEGISLQLWYDGIIKDYISDSDERNAIVYYIKNAETKIFHRLQNENFGVEYETVTGLSFTPKKLLKEVVIGFDLYLRMLDINDVVRSVHINRYPPFATLNDTLGFSGGFIGEGEYKQSIIPVPDISAELGFSGGFVSGEYKDLIVTEAFSHAIGFEGGFISGSYVSPIVEISDEAEELGFNGGFVSGDYVEVVITNDASETFGMTGGFSSGTYSAV